MARDLLLSDPGNPWSEVKLIQGSRFGDDGWISLFAYGGSVFIVCVLGRRMVGHGRFER